MNGKPLPGQAGQGLPDNAVAGSSFSSEQSSPSKLVLGKQQSIRAADVEELNRMQRTASMFNYESLRKKRLEKKLGIAEEDSEEDKAETPAGKEARNKNDLLLAPQATEMTEGGRRISSFASQKRLRELQRKEDEAAAALKYGSSQCEGGLYLIKQGYCAVRNHDDGFQAKRLNQGDFFGESDLLKCVGYSFFGEIVADSDDVECWFIPQEKFAKIPLFEQMHMKTLAESRRDVVMLGFDYAKRYNIDMAEYQSYFG